MANKDRIFFGSLETKEKERIEKTNIESTLSVPSPPQQDVLPFSAKVVESQEKHKQLLQSFEQNRRARQIAVPTNDSEVQARLRELKEPIILFGEKPEDRRTRLRELLAKLNIPEGILASTKEHKRKAEDKEEAEAYLTEGTPELKMARLWIADYSSSRAKTRISSLKRKRDALDMPDMNVRTTFTNFGNSSSEIGDDRPLTGIAFAPSSQMLATGGWSGLCKLWDVSPCKQLTTLRGHTERIHDIAFHPQSTLDLSPQLANLATGAADGVINLWPIFLSDSKPTSNEHEAPPHASISPIASLKGHTNRVNSVSFHPSGRYIGSASSDKTWRFWDVNTGIPLLIQEGHSRAVHAIAFQVDGSLVATGGDDTIIRVWDLRSGKSVFIFQGHVKQIVDMDFAPNGYHLASGGDDHTVRVWDLRKKRNVHILPAHPSLISTVRYQKEGAFLLTASFDKTCKIWDTSDWTTSKVLASHESRVMGADFSPDGKHVATACYDRTWKLWCDETLPR